MTQEKAKFESESEYDSIENFTVEVKECENGVMSITLEKQNGEREIKHLSHKEVRHIVESNSIEIYKL